MKFQDEIKTNHLERINSIYYHFNEFSKAMTIDSIYQVNDFFDQKIIIDKLGSEIKEKLTSIISSLEDEKYNNYLKISEIMSSLEVKPTGEHQNQSSGLKLFDYDQLYTQSNEESTDYKKMMEYNSCANNINFNNQLTMKLHSIKFNLDDKKKYLLPLGVANKLGF